MNSKIFFASAEAAAGEKSDLLTSLGVDVRLLVVQMIAFLILLWVLTKFVYPVLSGMLEKREATIREGIEAAQDAEKKADEAKAEVAATLENARKQATKIMASAKNEAASVLEAASVTANERTERMIAKANNDIERQVESARKALRDETVGLVALATEKVVGATVTEKVDHKVIENALKNVKEQ